MSHNNALAHLHLHPAYASVLDDLLRPFRRTYVDILVVVDTEIATQPGVGFGIGSVIELLRETAVGCMRFRVDIAQRSTGTPAVAEAPGAFEPKYTAFRFDMQADGAYVIDKYEQIWCFGFKPDNNGGPDSNIDQPAALPATDAELAKLASWMQVKKGGVFATGDHDYLGASMCRRIPRIGTMRRWTNADGVPPIGTPDRIDTLRPPGPSFEPGAPGGPADLNNTPHQGDTTIQPIQWVAWQRVQHSVFFRRERPHPVLCHPTLGPIDVMPDHAHEGLCQDTGTVPLDGTYDFGAGGQPEYPDATGGGPKPAPRVIAYGSTLGDPPYNFGKGAQPARARFPMISVYDGHLAGVGRCATDSTWHHWMDVNILAIKGAGGSDWEKVKRYYVNLALWLNPPGYTTDCFLRTVFASHFNHVGMQEYSPKLSNFELGRSLHAYLVFLYGPCWVTQWTLEILDFLKIKVYEDPRFPPRPDPCLTCPPFDLMAIHVLGGMVRATFDEAARVHASVRDGKGARPFKSGSLEDLMLPDVRSAVRAFAKEWQEDLARSGRSLAELESRK